jgi:CDP-diglyceride synthetase
MSFIAANGGTVQQGDKNRSQLMLRVASAVVLAPVVLLCIHFGAPWFTVLIGVAVTVMAWEWSRLCHEGAFAPDGLIAPAVALVALVFAALGHFALAAAITLGGAAIAWGLAAALRRRGPGSARCWSLLPVLRSCGFGMTRRMARSSRCGSSARSG